MRTILFKADEFQNIVIQIKEENESRQQNSLQTIPTTFYLELPPRLFSSKALDTKYNLWLRKFIGTLPRDRYAIDSFMTPELGKRDKKPKPSKFQNYLSLMQEEEVMQTVTIADKEDKSISHELTANAAFPTLRAKIPVKSIWMGFCRGGINEPDLFFVTLDPKEAELLISSSRSITNSDSSYKMWSWFYTSTENFPSWVHYIFGVLKKECELDNFRFLDNKRNLVASYKPESYSLEAGKGQLELILPQAFFISKTDKNAILKGSPSDLIMEYIGALPNFDSIKCLTYLNSKAHKIVYNADWEGPSNTKEKEVNQQREEAEINLQRELMDNAALVVKSSLAPVFSQINRVEDEFRKFYTAEASLAEEKTSDKSIAQDLKFFSDIANKLKGTLITKNYASFKTKLMENVKDKAQIPSVLIAMESNVNNIQLKNSREKAQLQFKEFVSALLAEEENLILWENKDTQELAKRLGIENPISAPSSSPVVMHTSFN